MALLRRKRLVRFSAQEPTFIEPLDCETLTRRRPSESWLVDSLVLADRGFLTQSSKPPRHTLRGLPLKEKHAQHPGQT
jgi:hypothetical protein